MGIDKVNITENNQILNTLSKRNHTSLSALPTIAYRYQGTGGFTFNAGLKWSKSYEQKGGYQTYFQSGIGYGF